MRSLPLVATLHSRAATAVVCAAVWLLCAGSRAQVSELPPATIAARALVITDSETLAPFTFERVVAAVSADPPAGWLQTMTRPTSTPTQIVMPFAGFIASAVDDGRWLPAGSSGWSHMRPIAIVNRFDLASADSRNCGEYRLIFSRRTGDRSRLHIAFETVLPNPEPGKGKKGCANVAAFWWELASIDSSEERRERLERFFFGGLPSIPAVFDRRSFESAGRIRTSEISGGRPKFAQYEWKRGCGNGQPCVSRLIRVSLDNMPDGALFDAGTPGERGEAFRHEFLRQVASLAVPDVNRYFMNVDRAYAVRAVDALVPAFNYRLPFRRSQRTAAGMAFRERIARELKTAGSSLTPEDIIDRAETQNCVGCHGKPGSVGGGVVFPSAFEHGEHIADESLLETARLSPALEEVFVPYRIELLRKSVAMNAEKED
jgi:hypothetical protein